MSLLSKILKCSLCVRREQSLDRWKDQQRETAPWSKPKPRSRPGRELMHQQGKAGKGLLNKKLNAYSALVINAAKNSGIISPLGSFYVPLPLLAVGIELIL